MLTIAEPMSGQPATDLQSSKGLILLWISHGCSLSSWYNKPGSWPFGYKANLLHESVNLGQNGILISK